MVAAISSAAQVTTPKSFTNFISDLLGAQSDATMALPMATPRGGQFGIDELCLSAFLPPVSLDQSLAKVAFANDSAAASKPVEDVSLLHISEQPQAR